MLTACPGRIEGTLLYTPIPASGGTYSGHGPGSVFLYTRKDTGVGSVQRGTHGRDVGSAQRGTHGRDSVQRCRLSNKELPKVGSSHIKSPKIPELSNSRGGCSAVGRPCNRDLRGPVPVAHGIERFVPRVRCPVVKGCRFESVGVQFPSTPFLIFSLHFFKLFLFVG